MVKTFSKVTEYWLSDPSRALEAQTRLFAGYLTVWGNAISRARTGEEPPEAVDARPRRQALPGSGMGQERLLRFPEAGLPRHLALGERPRREGRRARRAHPPQGELLRQAGLQRDLAVELHPDQPGALPRDGRLQRREPRARHEDARRGHRRRQGRLEAEAGRLFALRDRQEHRGQPRQDRRPQRRRRDHPVRAGDRDGAEAAAC